MKKNILTIVMLFWTLLSFGQSFDRTYQGWWADTGWVFEFKSNGHYERISSGHYGNTKVKGKYNVLGDTIQLTSGYKNTHGTVNNFYIMEGDSIIIDLHNRYDYKVISENNPGFHNSQIRDLKYPQVETNVETEKNDLEKVLNLALNSKEMITYYHFDKQRSRRLLIANYGVLNATVKVGDYMGIFKPISEIRDKFFIEFKDINLNSNRIKLELEIHKEGVIIWFIFYKEDGQWKYIEPSIYEK